MDIKQAMRELTPILRAQLMAAFENEVSNLVQFNNDPNQMVGVNLTIDIVPPGWIVVSQAGVWSLLHKKGM